MAATVTEELAVPRPRPRVIRIGAAAPPPTARLVGTSAYSTDTRVRARRGATVLVLLALIGLGVALAPIDVGVASVGDYTVTSGTVEITAPDADPAPAAASGPLVEGAGLRTGAGAAATISLGEGGIVRMAAGTAVGVATGTDDDPAATRTRRVVVEAGHVWASHDDARDPVPLTIIAGGVTLRVGGATADIGCDGAGCTVRTVAGAVVATAGWDRFQLHAGESVHLGPAGEVGRLAAVARQELLADAWVARNLAADAAGGHGSGDPGGPELPALVDAQIEGSWQVSTTVTASTTAVRPVGPEPDRTWGVSRDCTDGGCHLAVVDVAGDSATVGTSRPGGGEQHIDGITRTFDCIDSGTGAVSMEDAIAETRRLDVRATAAVRSGGRWVASEVAGSGDGDLHWAGRGRICRGVRPGTFGFDLHAVRLDLAS